MDSDSEHSAPFERTSVAELLARPACNHMAIVDDHSRHFHIIKAPFGSDNRLHDRWRFVFAGSHPDEIVQDFTFEDLDMARAQFTDLGIGVLTAALDQPIWHDVSAYPPFPLHAYYHSPQRVITLHRDAPGVDVGDSEKYRIFGAAGLTNVSRDSCVFTPKESWLVLERPSRIYIVHGPGTSYSPDINKDQLTPVGYVRNWVHLHRELKTSHSLVKPMSLEVYGVPPTDWKSHEFTVQFG